LRAQINYLLEGRNFMHLTLHTRDAGFILDASGKEIPAVVGRSGLIEASMKREGDGKTPRGSWPLREVLFRPDRITLPDTRLETRSLSPEDGWCDDPASSSYNCHVSLPFDASHEKLWRKDHAYDVIIPLGYNDDPAEAGRGSAIFFHCLEQGRHHTDGCVAINVEAMQALLPHLTPESMMFIDP
jgi:L,D-peptidoglycan transpeptidase YkuD (ErfK/YbiS/YcfS/YnhG family)